MRILLIALFTLSSSLLTVKAQQPNLDSLYAVWQDQGQTDSVRAAAYSDYIWKGFLFSNPDTAFILAEELVVFGQEKQYPEAQAVGYSIQGLSFDAKSNYPKALEYFQRSLEIREESGNKQGVGHALNNIGNIYSAQNNYPKALEYFERTLKIREEMGDKMNMAGVLINIGGIYSAQSNYPKALEYYERSLKIMEEIGSKRGIAINLGNIGGIYQSQSDYPKALEYLQHSLKIYEERGAKQGIARNLSQIGGIYQSQSNYPKALEYLQRSLKIMGEMGDKRGTAANIAQIGEIYNKESKHQDAIIQCKKALEISEEIGSIEIQKECCACLYKAHKELNNWQKALAYFELEQQLTDSLKADETNKQLQQFEFDRKILEADLEREKDKREQQVAHQKEITQKNKIQYTVIGLAVIIMLVAIGLFARLRYTRKTKKIIEKEKHVAETERSRSDELLLNILPADVAEELKNTGASKAKHFDEVSILFTDFKGFTQVSEKLSAKDLVNEINTCFKAFDNICEKYGIEKIKTIGDAYMAAGGLPVLSDDSIKNTALAALEMQAFIAQRKAENDASNKAAFEMRVGIHTGPVVAGIVGVKKFQYDIWGDTVNTASRMESADEVGKVNISQATYELLKDDADFSFESRGKIEAKGKGEMEMWFVLVKKEYTNFKG